MHEMPLPLAANEMSGKSMRLLNRQLLRGGAGRTTFLCTPEQMAAAKNLPGYTDGWAEGSKFMPIPE